MPADPALEAGVAAQPVAPRSALFAPAVRADLVRKLPRAGADAVVVDLEDSVPAPAKADARRAARMLAEELVSATPGTRVFVRVNAVPTAWFAADVAEALGPGVAGVVVPKLQSAAEVAELARSLEAAGFRRFEVIAGVETASGVLRVEEVLTGPVTACYFGAEDFITDMAGRRTGSGVEVLYARSRVALAARVAGLPALDQVVVDFRDDVGFVTDANAARDLGYQGKMCIHPRQVPLANEVFSVAPAELDRARRLLAAYRHATQGGVAVVEFEGQMVDEPLARRASALLRAAGQPDDDPPYLHGSGADAVVSRRDGSATGARERPSD
jgi:citrate lyase subunit beta/citryl-CoA lyase